MVGVMMGAQIDQREGEWACPSGGYVPLLQRPERTTGPIHV